MKKETQRLKVSTAKSRGEILPSRKHAEEPCSLFPPSIAMAFTSSHLLLDSLTVSFTHYIDPFQFLSFSTAFLIRRCWWNREDFPACSQTQDSMPRTPGSRKKTHTQQRAVYVRGKAFAAMKIPMLQLHNQCSSHSFVSPITLLV